MRGPRSGLRLFVPLTDVERRLVRVQAAAGRFYGGRTTAFALSRLFDVPELAITHALAERPAPGTASTDCAFCARRRH